VSIVKDEMCLLNVVDKPGSDVDQYVKDLDRVLLNKMATIGKLRDQLLNFHKNLKTEEKMSALYL
jgi:kinesin family protein 2/24